MRDLLSRINAYIKSRLRFGSGAQVKATTFFVGVSTVVYLKVRLQDNQRLFADVLNI